MRLARLSVAALLAIATSVATFAWADAPVAPGQVYLSAGAAYEKYAGKRDEGDNGGPVIGIGYRQSQDWGYELSFGEIKTNVGRGARHARLQNRTLRIGALRFFDFGDGWAPYLTAGLSRLDQNGGNIGPGSENEIDAGLGIFRTISGATSLRAELRGVYGSDTKKLEPVGTLTFVHALGGAAAAAAPEPTPAPAAAPEPAPAPVAAPVDTDGDGVTDDKDACPNTPKGAVVDEKGCPKEVTEQVTIDLLLEFDYNKSNLRKEHIPEIHRVAEFLRKFPNVSAVLEGHTDSRGTDEYNQKLSERRANAVRDYLVNKEGIASDRVSAVGFGESKPRMANDSEENMQRNRRVSAVITGGPQTKSQ